MCFRDVGDTPRRTEVSFGMSQGAQHSTYRDFAAGGAHSGSHPRSSAAVRREDSAGDSLGGRQKVL